MEILSIVSPPKFPQPNTPQTHKIKASSFPTFQPIKKLFTTIPNPTPKQPLPSAFFHSLDRLISAFLDRPLPPYLDPAHVLAGNFAPTGELPPTACHVAAGALPPALDGAYIRNGPNPQFVPPGPYHLFDGDGMLHAVKISGGKATLCSRYVKTHKYMVEGKIGHPVFQSIFSSFSSGLPSSMARLLLTLARVISGQYSPIKHGFGLANTNVALFHGTRLFALCESDLPYAIKITPDGDIVTIGRHFLNFANMTAHPKIDPRTGEVFAFSYSARRPFLTYFRIDRAGRETEAVPIHSMERASFVHDFAVTESYALFPDSQIVIEPAEVVRGRAPVKADFGKTARIGVLEKYGSDGSGVCWVDSPGLNVLHVVNAWEEDGGETAVMVASNVVGAEHLLGQMDLARMSMEKIQIDVKGKRVVNRSPVSGESLDFGVINPQYAGKKNRYVYAAVCGALPKITGVVKLDLSLTSEKSTHTVARRAFGPGCFGGEPFFVPKEPGNLKAEEDDGYLITFVHDETTEKSRFIVMDAKSPNLEIVADVLLPGRVPYGFHGTFVREKDLNNLEN